MSVVALGDVIQIHFQPHHPSLFNLYRKHCTLFHFFLSILIHFQDEKDKDNEKDKVKEKGKEETGKTDAEKEKEASNENKYSEKKDEKDEKTPEPDHEMLENPARVLPSQQKVLMLPSMGRYIPMKPVS